MNSNAWIFLAVLLGLPIGLLFGTSARRSRARVLRRSYTAITLLTLLGVLLGSISLLWQMTHPPLLTTSPTPLPARSQLILQRWDEQKPRASLSSLSGKDGAVHWSHPDQSPCNDISVVSDGILYQKGALPDKHGVCLQATRLRDGVQLWSSTVKTTSSFDILGVPQDQGLDQLLVANHRLYFQITGTFFLLDANDGKVLHAIQPTVSGDEDAAITNFAVNDQALVIAYFVSDHSTPDPSVYNKLVILQPTTADMLWKHPSSMNVGLIALQGMTLYALSQNKIVALDVRTASQVWQADLPSQGILASSTTAERLYVRVQHTDGSSDALVYAFDAHNGQLLWKVPVDSWAGAGTVDLVPIEANGVVYVMDTNTLSAYRATTGQLLWQYRENPLPNDSIAFDPYSVFYFSHPLVIDDVVFVTDTFTTSSPPPLRLVPSSCLGHCSPPAGILALNASSGKLYWRHEVPMSSSVTLLTASAS